MASFSTFFLYFFICFARSKKRIIKVSGVLKKFILGCAVCGVYSQSSEKVVKNSHVVNWSISLINGKRSEWTFWKFLAIFWWMGWIWHETFLMIIFLMKGSRILIAIIYQKNLHRFFLSYKKKKILLHFGISALTISLERWQEEKKIFSCFFNSLPSKFSPHENRILALSRAHGVWETSCMFKAFFCCCSMTLPAKYILSTLYHHHRLWLLFMKRRKNYDSWMCICKCENLF